MAGKRKAPTPASSKTQASGSRRSWGFGTRSSIGADGARRSWSERLTFRNRPRRTWKQWLVRGVTYVTVTGLVLALLAVGGFLYLYKTIDIPQPNDAFLTETSFVYYEDGESELGSFAEQEREIVSLDEMSEHLKDAVVAAENRTFYTDSGIDPKGILRAAFSNASGNSQQGASTITQQYVKILYLTQERSYTRKIKEAILSLKVQREQSKQEVLQGYLNTIYFGRGAYGAEAAANAFFGTSAADLNLRQSAVLASVLNNPSGLDPANGKDAKQRLKDRYAYVIGSMLEVGDISEAQAAKAGKRLPKMPEQEAESSYGGQKGHMLTMVKQSLQGLTNKATGQPFTANEIDGGGLRVTTTFSQKAMDAAQQGVLDAKPEGFGDKELHIGVASVEPGTGAVRGFYAGQDYLDSQINWAVSGGQAGSTFKAFALAAAIDQGFSLRDTFEGNSPYELPDGTEVENQGDADWGSAIDMIFATEKSANTAFVDMTLKMDDGPQAIIKMANKMGIPPRKPGKQPGFPDSSPGLLPNIGVALGSQTVSPINMANGYATLANDGVEAEPYVIEKVTDADGEVLYNHKVETNRAISADIAADVSFALQENVRAGSGTAALALERPAAGKTGTATATDADGESVVSSAWFAGYTPQMSTAVMYVRGKGNEQLQDWLPSYFGGAFPAETWTAVMRYEMEGLDVEDFPEPVYVDGDAPGGLDTAPSYTPPPQPTRKPT
ncbi:MAG: transglycosylase domain-containing protein, partial [Nocardioides sp.]|nr:transglycosylase domain-containing protein [Nocardioides sp.]